MRLSTRIAASVAALLGRSYDASSGGARWPAWASMWALPRPSPASVTSGDGVVVGNLFGIAAYDAGSGEEVEVSLVGVFELPKTSGQINAGAAVWWKATNGEVSNVTGSGFCPIGVAVKAAGTNDATVRVRLSGIPVAAAGG
jgi:predicted RecA/RadA family phage recombinase